MEINQVSNVQFTSRMNPIKPFYVNTQKGKIRVYEPERKEILKPGFIEELIDMFCRNFATFTKDPGWLRFNKPEFAKEFESLKKMFSNATREHILADDGHNTLLVARDKNKKLCAGMFSYGFDDIPGARNTTMYVDSIAVDEDFRRNKIAKKMLEKAINADKAHFSDVFVVAENLARGFYESLGFKDLNPKFKNQDDVITYMMFEREDFPKYVSFLTKTLQENKNRWYDISGPAARKLYGWDDIK